MSAEEYEPLAPWRRQPCDTDLGFALFCDYLLLAPGSRKWHRVGQRQISRGLLSAPQLAEWHREHGWDARAGAWDRQLQLVREDAIQAAVRRHAELGAALASLAGRELERLAKHADMLGANGGMPLLQTRDILRLAVYGARLEREALSAPQQPQGSGQDLSALSIEELRALAKI